MCGIAGLVGDFVPGLIERMNAAQEHRGPNGSGAFESPESQVALGHVRLAILDLSDQAAQPMCSPDGRYVLVYNGEIYNFAELRASLASAGLRPTSTGDTEVLMHALLRWGSRAVERLNGMFAFAWWDRHQRELLLVRDPLGIKPLYYAEPAPGTLVFASELKAICAHPGVRREPDFATIQQHLTFCHSCSDRTAIAGIRRLPPGSMLRWQASLRRPRITAYWQPLFTAPAGKSAARVEGRSEALELRDAVCAATRRQLVSDVPVGSFLSGGLDSSLITAIATRDARRQNRFRSYTITYPGQTNRLDQAHADAPYARSLATDLDLDFHEIEIGPQVAALLPRLIHHLDEPLADPAVITCFLISELAQKHGTKVMLSGQGADELFGGYPRYSALRAMRWMDRVPRTVRTGVAQGARLLPGAMAGRGGATLRRIRRVLRDIHRPAADRFLAYCMSTPPETARGVFSGDVLEALNGCRPDDDCRLRMASGGLAGDDRFLERDLMVYLPNHNLLYTDKMGMAVGVETRVPLLDQQVVNAALALSPAKKLNPIPKAILREAARGLVPETIINRPKAGFGAPYRHWLRHDLNSMWGDLMSPAAVARRGWFSPHAIHRIRAASQSGRADFYMLQWALLTVELWARSFLDRNPADAAQATRPTKRRERPVLARAA